MTTIITRRKAMATGAVSGLTLLGGMTGLTGTALAQEAGPDTRAYVMGDENAPLHIIEYASLTCPHCANFHSDVFPQLRENYIDAGLAKFEFREVYFDRLGLWGGMLARCGGGMRYFGIIGLLMEHQADWTQVSSGEEAVTAMRLIGAQAGLTDAQMDECLQDAELAEALVAKYQEHTEEYPITGTPSFVINGEMNSNMGYNAFVEKLDGLL
ncbi:Thioredoxin [Monaibacterium marinum]|uniref:Thioredoxin n=1 Tax=Pontivivens marinum TaxID=1690039 RepID=A0A2C9CPK6_9RHOB|nr:DsbA family protein [Monaibacterium marinum]SOH93157.1 Thioredoxin [Monaibacterium marinum]